MKQVALFPGTFDPITFGHIEILKRGLLMFDEIVIGMGTNTSKNTMFTAEQRLRWMKEYFADEKRIKVETFKGLTVNYAKSINAKFILRGLRSSSDFEYEKTIDLLNKHLNPNVETLYFISSPATAHISSTLVREIIRFRGHLEGLVPENIIQEVYK